MAQKPASFGKRGASRPAPGRAAPIAEPGRVELASNGVPLSDLAKSLMAETPKEVGAAPAAKDGVVPTSWRAGILAGLVVSAMQAGFVILKAKSGGDAAAASLVAMAGVDQDKALPFLLAGSLLSGAEATASTILFAHSALRRLHNVSFLAYGVGGGVAASALAWGAQALGLGEMEHGLALEVATGAAAGLFYRMFAGARG